MTDLIKKISGVKKGSDNALKNKVDYGNRWYENRWFKYWWQRASCKNCCRFC
jgi:hypothetical protein